MGYARLGVDGVYRPAGRDLDPEAIVEVLRLDEVAVLGMTQAASLWIRVAWWSPAKDVLERWVGEATRRAWITRLRLWLDNVGPDGGFTADEDKRAAAVALLALLEGE